MIAPARRAALECLLAVSSERLDLAAALEGVRATLADSRDRALVTDIVTGVQRWRAALDCLIAALANRRLEAIDPEVLEILRLSIYQLLHLTRVPAAAVVDDAVNLVGRVGKTSAKGFVNAVLRQVSRRRTALPLPPRPTDPGDEEAAIKFLSVTLSHPEWLVRRWLGRYGFEATEQWLHFNNSPAPFTIRANRLTTTREQLQRDLAHVDVTAELTPFAPDGLLIAKGDRALPQTVEQFDRQFVVQDEASQLVALLAGPHPGPRVLDACAAPGGKATALAAAMPSARTLVACDVRARRLAVLRRTLDRVGLEAVPLVQADAAYPLPFRPVFDCVLVDAPCSGLGTLRRDPDIKWRREPFHLPVFARAQGQMLRNAAAVVAPGGRLVYATCSSEPEENEEVAADFAGTTTGFRRLDARHLHPSLPSSVVDSDGDLRTWPPRHQLDAFFGAVFERDAGPDGPPRG